MREVTFLDLKAGYVELRSKIDAAVSESLASGRYIGGGSVESFEEEFASYTESGYCVSVANGLDALHLALMALQVGPGDEVIVPSHTFIATWLAVTQVGATVVPVEPNEETYTIDPLKIEAAITEKTKAIIPVHLYGHPVDLDPILEIASRRGIRVLEDAAQAHGARYKGRRIGAHGDLVAWSFYPGKNLGAFGDGGAVTTNNKELAEQIRKLGNYGSHKKYHHDIIGFNSRLDPIQAAILKVKLSYLDEWNARRRDIAKMYSNALGSSEYLIPKVADWADSVWHLYVIQSCERNALQEKLTKAGISTLIHYPVPPHLQPAYKSYGWEKGKFPIAEKISVNALSLPIGPHCDTEDIGHIVSSINSQK